MNQTIEALHWRYAVKKFSNRTIPQQKLEILLEALRLTPSSLGLQAWKFILVTNPEIRRQLVPATWNQAQVLDASHLLVLARSERVTPDDVSRWSALNATTRQLDAQKQERFFQMISNYLKGISIEEQGIWLDKQLYIALGNLLTVCALEGIDACPIEGFKRTEYDRILGLESLGLKSVVVCPFGSRADDDSHQFLPKVGFPMPEVVMTI